MRWFYLRVKGRLIGYGAANFAALRSGFGVLTLVAQDCIVKEIV